MLSAVVRGDVRTGWYVESSFAQTSEPTRVTNRYRVLGTEPARGNMGPAPQLADGCEVSYIRDSTYPHSQAKNGKACRWSLYANGAYLIVHADNEATEQVTEPILCPRVRRGVETRYYCGQWEKFTKRDGWVRI